MDKYIFTQSSCSLSLFLPKQYLVPALKDRLKYYRNYDANKVRGVKKEENMTQEQGATKKKTFKQQQLPKAPAVPVLSSGEDQASFIRHLKFL